MTGEERLPGARPARKYADLAKTSHCRGSGGGCPTGCHCWFVDFWSL